jgi:gamma-glutamyltranspeptidase/glutathione hydrolase
VDGAATYEHAAVAADHELASQAGFEMLQRGGNAVDAAVAASFALSVVRPDSCGVGGGGFMVIYDPPRDGRPALSIAINYRETCPAAVGPDTFTALGSPTASRFGVHACGVPGTVAGLLAALERYGTLDRATVLAPAIRLAEEGWPADRHHLAAMREVAEALETHPSLRPTAVFVWERLCGSGTLGVGDRLENRDQARALRLIASHGTDAFYRGSIAEAIVDVMGAEGGPMTHQDLAGYQPQFIEPLRGAYQGHVVLTMPPPSSGGLALIQILGIYERGMARFSTVGKGIAPMHLLVEAMKHAFADRARWLADPAFVDVPIARLISASYLDERAAQIDAARTLASGDYGSQEQSVIAPATDDGGTSHLSVVDGRGMAVACSETVNLAFGSLVTVPGFGFQFNNQMDDFTTEPDRPNAFGLMQSSRNCPQPGKRPLSSMTPTILVRDDRAAMAIGASGGPRIITAVAQCIVNGIPREAPLSPVDAPHPMSAAALVAAPRLHHQWMPDIVQYERVLEEVGASVLNDLIARGHIARPGRTGNVQLVRVPGPGRIEAVCDPRKGGKPAGN